MVWRLWLLGAVAMVGAAEYASAQLTMGGGLNKDCIDMNIQEDICWTSSIPPVPYPCAHLRFWQPKWIVQTHAGYANLGGDHFHFHHGKVKPVDQGFAFNDPCMGCVVPTLNAVVDHFYDSRDDPEWKTAQRASAMPTAVDLQRIGWWGRLYPRVGYATHTSPLSASGLAATRAFSLARQPVDLWPVAGKYRLDGCQLPQCGPIVPPASPPAVGFLPCMNLEVPARRGCYNAGVNLLNAFDQAASDGRYKWVVWKRRRCTLPMPLQACAYALEGLPKDNSCF
ncbi:MAG: hypothetical protein OXP66_00665 [Candidatus Tectomicrobia bacterium]|nr:hypothetical protein [Candidatus Tectomicrobia bacterium]